MPEKRLLLKELRHDFGRWLGDRKLSANIQNEIFRWNNEPGKPMKIIYTQQNSDYFSVNDAAVDDVQKFLAEKNIPESGKIVDIAKLVQSDIEQRACVGERKYGVRLQPSNGCDALIDAYQEALDLCMYLRQAIEERVDIKDKKCHILQQPQPKIRY
jgi:hypothetical protein